MVLKPGAVMLPRGFAILVVVSERLLGSGLGQSDSPKPVGPAVREEPRWDAYGPASRPRAQPIDGVRVTEDPRLRFSADSALQGVQRGVPQAVDLPRHGRE